MIFLDENKIKEDYDRFMSLIEEDERSKNLQKISAKIPAKMYPMTITSQVFAPFSNDFENLITFRILMLETSETT